MTRHRGRPDADFEARVAASFARQTAMATLGDRARRVAPGEVELRMAHRADLTQQHGFLHAGIVACALDSGLQLCRVHADAGRRGGADGRVQDQPDRASKGLTLRFEGHVVKAGRTDQRRRRARAAVVGGRGRRGVARRHDDRHRDDRARPRRLRH